jgi:hypothetical protein
MCLAHDGGQWCLFEKEKKKERRKRSKEGKRRRITLGTLALGLNYGLADAVPLPARL